MSDTPHVRMFQQNASVEAAPLRQEAILFHPQSQRFCVLNRTSTFIWNRLQSPATPEQIAEGLSAAFAGVTPVAALKDVTEALQRLMELDLVVVYPAEVRE